MAKNLSLMTQVAYLYYMQDKTQATIAHELGVGRSSVSRLLKQARALGLVEIKINHFDAHIFSLQSRLRAKFGLKHVAVIPTTDQAPEDEFSRQAAEYISTFIHSNQTIGISWGTTIGRLINQLPPRHLSQVHIFPVVGGPGYIDTKYHVNTLVYALSQKLNGKGTFINASVIEESVAVRQGIVEAKYFAPIQQAWAALDLAIVSVGGGLNARNQWQALLSPADVTDLKLREAVGDCCGQFYDASGKLIDNEVAHRTIAIPLSQLAQVPVAVAVVNRPSKTAALRPVLRRHYVNSVIVDQTTAERLLK